VKDVGLLDMEKRSQLPDAPESLWGWWFPLSVFCKEVSEYLRKGKSDSPKIFTDEIYGSMAYAYGSTAAPPLLWWHKLKLDEYIRNQASD
jgi:hypothetical protein